MLANPDARWMKRRRRVGEASLSPDHAGQDRAAIDNGDNGDDVAIDNGDTGDDVAIDNGDDDDSDGVQHMEAKANAGLTASSLASSRAFLSWESGFTSCYDQIFPSVNQPFVVHNKSTSGFEIMTTK